MLREALAAVVAGRSLTPEEARGAMDEIMTGAATPAQIGGLLVALRVKGETPAEVAGFARSMRANAVRIQPRVPTLVDTCGTGGDGLGTVNISTLAALVVAGAGVPVAKHGNRSVSSACGSADLLEALGVAIDLGPEAVSRCIEEVGLGFLFAPRFHPSMRHAAAPRRELGMRTVFNILGPLTNPAGAPRQLLGTYDAALVRPMAEVLAELGTEHALVVHGAGGMDELSLAGPTRVAEVVEGQVRGYQLDPAELGLAAAPVEALRGGSAQENAAVALEVLRGADGAVREAVVLNAGAALLAAGRAGDLREGLALARESLRSGAAYERLTALRELSQREAQPSQAEPTRREAQLGQAEPAPREARAGARPAEGRS